MNGMDGTSLNLRGLEFKGLESRLESKGIAQSRTTRDCNQIELY
jgi:hypothetical protein